MTDTIAILCSDIHFSHNPPAARSAEDDWYEAMRRQWEEVWNIAEGGQLPIIIAGDIFDRWNSPPELTNFVMDTFGQFAAILTIPGQHDLPNHNYRERYRSAYGTLERAEVIVNLIPERAEGPICGHAIDEIGTVWVSPFPWGFDPTPIEHEDRERPPFNLAVCHSFICLEPSFPGSEEKTVEKYLPKLEGYDAAVFGDNHRGFKVTTGEPIYRSAADGRRELEYLEMSFDIMNCGTFYRRHADEIDYRPQIGLLQSDGTIKVHHLDVSKDKFLSRDETKEKLKDTQEFHELMRELRQLGPDSLDFRAAINRFMESQGTDPVVREVVLETLN